MSDTASHAAATPEHAAELFSPGEIKQFGVDDVTAGGAIGKMLSALLAGGHTRQSLWTKLPPKMSKAVRETSKIIIKVRNRPTTTDGLLCECILFHGILSFSPRSLVSKTNSSTL